jgi:hypothetical protein
VAGLRVWNFVPGFLGVLTVCSMRCSDLTVCHAEPALPLMHSAHRFTVADQILVGLLDHSQEVR